MRDRRFGFAMTAPGLAALMLIILFPVLWATWTSLHDYTLIAPNFETFLGHENFLKAIGDPEFQEFLRQRLEQGSTDYGFRRPARRPSHIDYVVVHFHGPKKPIEEFARSVRTVLLQRLLPD